ncbi:MAG: DUF58 domain-containing protein [Clostridia bacterium]|nr:DUF58 domain-containing protein [Clostridia bacterium]
MSIVWILVSVGIVILAQGVLAALFGLKNVGYDRRFSRRSAYEGEQVELVEVIRNRKILPVPWVRVESRISPFLRCGHGGQSEEREISADQYHKSVFYLGPFSQITRRHDVACLKRGHYEVGSVALTAGDLLAVWMTNRQMNIACALDVYPRLLSEDELDTPSTRWQGELAVKRWIMPDPFLVSGIRDYRAGDPLRDVHWRASARTGTLQVKTRDYTADPRMLVVLNVQASEEQWGDLMDYEQEGIEQGVRIAATLCKRALDAGVEAGFATNGCMTGEKGTGKTILIPARRSNDQMELLLTAMARMEIHREITFPTLLETLCSLQGEDILILSVYDSEQIQARVDMLRAAGNSVTMMRLERGHRREANREKTA